MNMTSLLELVEKINTLPEPTIIAIGGFGGSGKTTLADELQKTFPSAIIIRMDDFIVKEKLTEPSWDKGAFDRDRLEKQVLKPLSEGRPAQYQKLIWGTNTLSEFVEVPNRGIIIVEGISSYHPNIAHYYDYKIWVETPMEIAKERGHARDGSNENAKYWDLWARNDSVYQERYRPDQTADYVFING